MTDQAMDPSQLRRLAKDHAAGRLTLEEYRDRRRALIDGIAKGIVPIERERANDGPRADPPTLKPPPPVRVRRSTRMSVFAGTLVIVLVAWALWSALEPSPGPGGPTLPQVRVPVRQVSEARGVVEIFVAAREWDEKHIAQFERDWDALSPEERAQARAAPWFARLIAALNEALEARTAAGSESGQSATMVSVHRLRALGAHLGVAPALSSPTSFAIEPNPPLSSPTLPMPAADPAPTFARSAPIVNAPPAPPPIIENPANADRRDETSSQWLARQPDSAFTLQLLSVEYLDQVERLMTRHPSLVVQVLDYREDRPRFRVLHGSFDSREQAVAAHGRLPWQLRSERPRADVRPFVELKSTWASARGGEAASKP